MQMLCLLFYYVNAVTHPDKIFYGGDEETIELKPGDYTFHVYGAQGGDAYRSGSHSTSDGDGGKGAYIKGGYHITTPTSIKVIVGTKGKQGAKGPNAGGFPDGGSGGEDTGGCMFSGANDASGGGGGSSKILKGSTKLIVAAGGSGGAASMDGCPGSSYDKVYCSTNLYTCVPKNPTDTQPSYVEPEFTGTFGIATGHGGDGKDSCYTPGSGGGGGFYGGRNTNQDSITDHYQSVACGGSSYYYSSLIKNIDNSTGSRTGDGYIRIETNYLCMEECGDCQSDDSCSKCSGKKGLLNGRCVDECPSGQSIKNNECKSCTNNCGECAYNDLSKCTQCYGEYSLYDSQCLVECPAHYYSENNECKECSDTCSECSGSSTCTKCNEGDYLYRGWCYSDSCPDGSYLSDEENMVCSSCDSSCLTCSNSDRCDSCNAGYHVDDNTGKCVSECESGQYKDDDGNCQQCSTNCLECSESPDKCISCDPNSEYNVLYENQCLSTCPDGTFHNGITCQECSSNCSTCSSPEKCLSCPDEYNLYDDVCYPTCPSGTYQSSTSPNECSTCSSNCLECSNSPDHCTKCNQGFHLYYSKEGIGYCSTSRSPTGLPLPYLLSFLEKPFI